MQCLPSDDQAFTTATAVLSDAGTLIRLRSLHYVERDTALRACSTSDRIKRVRTDARGQMTPKRRRYG